MIRNLEPRDPQAIRDGQQPVWNRAAETYLESFATLLPQAVPPLLDAAWVGSGTRVLDVATGPGLVAAAALERGAKPTGIDFADKMIDEARRRHPAIEFHVGDAASLPFEDATFDAVVIGFALFLMAEPLQALREARRVLRRGGRVAFTVWDAPLPAFDLFYGAMARWAPSAFPAEDPPLFGVTDPDALTSTLDVAGFTETSIERLPVIWQLPSGDALYDALSTLRDFSAMPPHALAAFRAEVLAGAGKYERDGRFFIPNPALLVSGMRP